MTGQTLSIVGVRKSYGDKEVLSGVDLHIGAGEFVTLLGPSGCGKSTLLRTIAGFEFPDAGRIELGGKLIDGLPPKMRDLAMVFQSYALYPHMTVSENIAMPLLMRQMGFAERFPILGRLMPRHRAKAQEIRERVQAVAERLEIAPLLGRKPGQLSGGQRQRVAVGRAMVRQPGLFLMDEPLSNLDAKLRVHMRSELVELNRSLGVTFLYVTHDQTEAMTMSDRVVLLMDGVIRQIGSPSEIYREPVDLTVAQFVGHPKINVLPGNADGRGGLTIAGKSHPISVEGTSGPVSVGIRPEALSLTGPTTSQDQRIELEAHVQRTELLGADMLVWFNSPALGAHNCVAQIRAKDFDATLSAGRLGEVVRLQVDTSGLHIFDAAGRRCDWEKTGALNPLAVINAGGALVAR